MLENDSEKLIDNENIMAPCQAEKYEGFRSCRFNTPEQCWNLTPSEKTLGLPQQSLIGMPA